MSPVTRQLHGYLHVCLKCGSALSVWCANVTSHLPALYLTFTLFTAVNETITTHSAPASRTDGMMIDLSGMGDVVLTRKGIQCVVELTRNLAMRVPHETILDFVFLMPDAPDGPTIGNPAIPKPGKSPFFELEPEIVRKIFAESLPAKHQTIKCHCEFAEVKKPRQKSPRNRVSALMTICSKFKDIVKEAVYAERFFEIHIHQGGMGGVELLNAGAQPLAYMENASDDRFARFTDNEYGIKDMKKFEIAIFPTVASKRSKAVMLNTYFMIQAICRLLECCGEEKDRIVSIKITFPRVQWPPHIAGRHNIMAEENFWWDLDSRAPRCTSIHNMPDIELALHGFASLTRVHHVQIELPALVKHHEPTVLFVARLIAGMTSRSSGPNSLLTAEQGLLIQSMRQQTEDYIFSEKFGRSSRRVERLGEDECGGLDDVEMDDGYY